VVTEKVVDLMTEAMYSDEALVSGVTMASFSRPLLAFWLVVLQVAMASTTCWALASVVIT